MSQQIVNSIDAQRPHLLRKNDHESDGHFLYYACQALGPDWMLLSKSDGENGYTWPNGQRTSHDAICQVDALGNKLQQVDIIASAGNGQPASPAWGTIPPHEWRASNRPVPLSRVPAPGGVLPVPDPPPPPTPPDPPPPTGPICPDRSAHQPLPPVDPLRWIGDNDLLAIADEFVARGRRDDVGGMVDAGSQFGRRIQARYSREQALKETRDWISFWYGPRP